VSGFTPDGSDGPGQIHLDSASNNNFVVCAETTDIVFNQGTHNVINGCDTTAAAEAAVKANPAIGAKRVITSILPRAF
jgi:hypothetical protein